VLAAALGSAALAAGCGEGTALAPAADAPCGDPPVLPLGDTVRGRLEAARDCRSDDGRLYDAFQVILPGPEAVAVTLTTEGYRPFLPFYGPADSVQLSGWASSDAFSLTREHLFPAGRYLLRASSFERPGGPDEPPVEGGYTLSTRLRPVPQEGCGRETSVTYGSVARGRLTPDDCLAVREPEPATPRLGDGYDLLLRPGVPVEVTLTADAPVRLAVWANGQPVDVLPAIPPGELRRIQAGGAGFLSVYVLEEEEHRGGWYTLAFQEALEEAPDGAPGMARVAGPAGAGPATSPGPRLPPPVADPASPASPASPTAPGAPRRSP
jgi:hypothetical protein